MISYKDLFYKSQTAIADTIEKLDLISTELKKCMQECEDEIIPEDDKVINISEEKGL